jgi:hypothetical protein
MMMMMMVVVRLQRSLLSPSEDGSQSFLFIYFFFPSPFPPFLDAELKMAVQPGKAG